jgi:hypothetical protein
LEEVPIAFPVLGRWLVSRHIPVIGVGIHRVLEPHRLAIDHPAMVGFLARVGATPVRMVLGRELLMVAGRYNGWPGVRADERPQAFVSGRGDG